MTQVISELRGRFVQVTQMKAKQAHARGVCINEATHEESGGQR